MPHHATEISAVATMAWKSCSQNCFPSKKDHQLSVHIGQKMGQNYMNIFSLLNIGLKIK